MVGEVTLWDTSDRKPIGKFQGHTRSITGLAFSQDGELLVTASNDKSLILWNVSRGRELLTLRGHTHPITGAAFRPGRRLEVVSVTRGSSPPAQLPTGFNASRTDVVELQRMTDDPAEVKIWDLRDTSELLTFPGEGSAVRSVSFSPDGSRLVAGDQRQDQGLGRNDRPEGPHSRARQQCYRCCVQCRQKTPCGQWRELPEDRRCRLGTYVGREYVSGESACSGKIRRGVCMAYRPDGKELAAGCWDVSTPMKQPPKEGAYSRTGLSWGDVRHFRPTARIGPGLASV